MEPGPDPTTAIVLVDGKKPPLPSSMSKKKRGAMSILRAALFMWRRRSSRKRSKATALQVEVATASAEMLNKVVGSMRPLHAKGGESPPHLAGLAAPAQDPAAETLLLPSASPSRSEQFEDVASASDGSMSRYSSALNLQELEKIERVYNPNDDEDNLVDGSDAHARDYDANAGDEMIDVKAEEFIARFYEQMRIQNQDEMSRRSAYHS